MNARSPQEIGETANPFVGANALRYSNYTAPHGGKLARPLDGAAIGARAKLAHSELRDFLLRAQYPCVGARAAVVREEYRFGLYGSITQELRTEGLARDLVAFERERRANEAPFATFVAIFNNSPQLDERSFETSLWKQLSALSALDRTYFSADPDVSADPADATFGFSFARSAFFVVGLHPESSRAARRFRWPALAFNAHEQFRRLRVDGTYQRFQRTIRKRELALQGTLNPNLAEFGEASEARQYSGRTVEPDWTCPFRG